MNPAPGTWSQGLSAALTNPALDGEYLARRLRELPHEVFAGLLLDNRPRAIALEDLFRGGALDGTEVYPREVFNRCLAHNAAAWILGHNRSERRAERENASTPAWIASRLHGLAVHAVLALILRPWHCAALRGWIAIHMP